MCLRVSRVVEEGIAIDDDVLYNHRGLILRYSILGESFLGLELGIEMTTLALKAQPVTVSVTILYTSSETGEVAGVVASPIIWDAS